MVEDAEKYAEEDRRRREVIELRNQADNLLYQNEKTLKDQSDKLDAALKAELEEAVSGLKEALGADDDDAVRTRMEALAALSQRVAEAIYKASADEAETGATDPTDSVDDAEIVDAEVVDEGDGEVRAS